MQGKTDAFNQLPPHPIGPCSERLNFLPCIRFAYFCQAALDYLRNRSVNPDVIHCHDWPTAPIAWGDRGSARCVFTIHNLSYGADLIGRAMASCEVATTVSPTYAQEVSSHA